MNLSDSSLLEGSELYAVKKTTEDKWIERTLPISIWCTAISHKY